MAVKSQAKRLPNLLLNNPQYSGTISTLLYNWPIFIGLIFFGLVTVVAGFMIPTNWGWPMLWHWVLLTLGWGSFGIIGAILLATYFVYDRGQKREYDRLAELGAVSEANVVLDITCGKMRGTRGLLPHFQQGHYFLIDIYDEQKMTDQALSRARKMEPPLDTPRRIYRQAGRPISCRSPTSGLMSSTVILACTNCRTPPTGRRSLPSLPAFSNLTAGS